MKLDTSQTSSSAKRRARTRSLIQLGGLLEHAGALEIFNIPLGIDLQQDPSVKNNIAALFKSFLIINDMVTSQELDLEVLALQGLQSFKDKGLSEERPLDRKKHQEIEAYSENSLANEVGSNAFEGNEVANDNAQLSSTQLLRTHVDKLQENLE